MNPPASEKDKERRVEPQGDVQEIFLSSLHPSTSAQRDVNAVKVEGREEGRGRVLWQIDNNCLT